jgi:hypothetical protein
VDGMREERSLHVAPQLLYSACVGWEGGRSDGSFSVDAVGVGDRLMHMSMCWGVGGGGGCGGSA